MDTYLADSRLFTWPTRLAKSRIVVSCLVPGEPISKQRPRFARGKNGNVYTPRQTVEAEMDIQMCLKAACPSLFPDSVKQYGIRCMFVQTTRHRRDIDNMTKLIMDACTGLVWGDDTQVIELFGSKTIEKDNPRTEIVIYSTNAPDAWTKPCELCGTVFRVYPSWKNRRFCSMQCSAIKQTQARSAKCMHCKGTIDRSQSGLTGRTNLYCSRECKTMASQIELTCMNCQKLFRLARSGHGQKLPVCSIECRIALVSVRELAQMRGNCPECGAPKSKRKYEMCRACRLKRGIKGRAKRNSLVLTQ